MSPEEMISRYGYFALFAGVAFEGEAIVIAASYAAHQGYLDPYWVIIVSFLGSILGDESYFFLGRFKGRAYLAKRPLWQLRVQKVQGLLERYHRWVVVGFRFLYGLRSVTPFALGMSNVKTAHFVVLNLIGAFVWSVVMGAFGFLIADIVKAVVSDVREYDRWVLCAILVAGALVWLRYYLKKRRLRRMAVDELARRRKMSFRTNGIHYPLV
jgi:membrane protein DedA with SNARE-associated domain